MGLFDADGEEGGGLFGADGPAKAAPQAERDTGSSMIVASLFATEDSDAGSVDFERLIGGGVVAIREAESDSGSDSGSESSATSAAEPAERRYRVVAEAGAIIREKFDLESEYVRTAEAGEVLESISTKVTDKGVVRVETAEGWVSQTTADGSTKLLHWLGAKEEPKPEPEPEPEPEPQTDLATAFWDYLAPTHKAIAELEAKKLAGDFWTCEWCGCELEDSEGTMLGPSGPDTLCTMCGTRYEDEWTCAWCKCSREDTSKILPGPEDCQGGLCFGCGTRHIDEQAAAELEKQAAEAAQRKIAAEEREEVRRQAEVKRKADAEARAAQIAQEKVRAEEAEAERVALDAQTSRRKRYRVVNQAVVRLGFNINSPTADVNGGRGSLHIGEVIEAIEERVNDSGVKRICFEDGWVSERAANGVVLLEPGTEWWRVIAPAKIRTGWTLESPPPPPIFPQALSVGEVFEAREIRQDDPADEDDPDDDDLVEALHLRFAVNRWVSEIDPGNDGQFVLEKLSPEEQEQYATTARRAQEAADQAEAERVQAERLKAEAEARAKADAAAAAKEAAIAKAKAEAARIRQAEADGTEVGQWLRNLNLSMYTVAFKEQGYEELEVLKHVLESQVEALMQKVEMAVGHSFRFRDGLSVLQAEDAESAQAVLDAEREFLINDATVKEAADLQASVSREKQAEELTALHVSARRAAIEHAAEAQERADLAELKAYQDNLATQMQRKSLSGDVAKREALEARFEQESALRKRVEAETALGTSRLRQVDLELRTAETKLRVAAEQEKDLDKRRNDAVSRRKADEIGRKMAESEVAELAPRVMRAEELAEAAARVANSAMEAEKAARDSLDTARLRARLGPELLVRKLTEGALEARDVNADETAVVDVNAAEAEQRQAAAEEEIRIGQVEALLRAAARGDESRLVQLLADGVDVNASDAEGDTALGLAAEHGHCEATGLLLANGAVFTQIPTSQWSYEQVRHWVATFDCLCLSLSKEYLSLLTVRGLRAALTLLLFASRLMPGSARRSSGGPSTHTTWALLKLTVKP